jgi:hypothetical protein
MGTVQEFRSQVWNTPSNNSWTSVQGSSAWPVNNNQTVPIKPSQKTKTINPPSTSNPQPTTVVPNSGSTTLWSNSWEPVAAVVPVINHKKKGVVSNNLPSNPVPQQVVNISKTIPLSQQNAALLNQARMELLEAYNNSSSSDDEIDDPLNPGQKRKKTPEEKQMIEEELSKQNLYKTELCRSFCETGSCRYGHKCQFAHGEHEVRPVMRHPKYKTEICKTYSNTGNCPYGNRCRFIHPGMNWNSNWPDDMGMVQDLISAVDQMNISSSYQQMAFQMQQNNVIPIQIQPQPVPIVATTPTKKAFIDLKEKETDVKNLVEDETEAKPRLAFFQNLTVL